MVPLTPAEGAVALFVLLVLLLLLCLLVAAGSAEEPVAAVESAKPEPDLDAFPVVVEQRPAD